MAETPARDAWPAFPVGHSGTVIRIAPEWRVLDVGSGHNPHPRANVLLERDIEDATHRAGAAADALDPRLVVGDGQSMPFDDAAFDHVIASHVAEHVDDPARFCRELQRVARRGYLETPGWIGDRILREDFHAWRVGRVGRGLRFRQVDPTGRPFGRLAEAGYVLLYYGDVRPGHRTLRFRSRPLDALMRLVKRVMGKAIRTPPFRSVFYTCFAWDGPFDCTVEWLDGAVTHQS